MIQERLSAIKARMKREHIDAFIVPTADPHLSEYLPEHWQGREWLSGFTGSAGTLVVMADFVGLWTDSRYWVQADIELDGTGIVLKKQGLDIDIGQFLVDNLAHKESVVAIDGAVLSVAQADKYHQLFGENIMLCMVDLLADVWTDRPDLPCADIVVHDGAFVDKSASEKFSQVREQMGNVGADYHLISSLDDIAWLTNLRGSDVSFNPVFLAHLLISADGATLFVNEQKLTNSAKTALTLANVNIRPYTDVAGALQDIEGTLLIDPNKVAVGTLSLFYKGNIKCAINPSTLLKAIKSPQDIEHIRQAMIQDGVALCEFFAELDERLSQGEMVSELDVADRLVYHRSQQDYYVSPSFDTIAGFGANGAIVHYKATPKRFSCLVGDGLLLIDSGAQYQNGTTDITRVVGVGSITDEQKTDITHVLKAHIALASAHFPKGLPSPQIDIVARAKLWAVGKDYGHGTGHGVGYFLNVHEAPPSISYHAPNTPERALQVGMVSSNEPAFYREGKWGVRLENLMVVQNAPSSEFGEFLCFETLTLCPFDNRLILKELLDNDEKSWLNDYHQTVRQKLLGKLSDKAQKWLMERTESI